MNPVKQACSEKVTSEAPTPWLQNALTPSLTTTTKHRKHNKHHTTTQQKTQRPIPVVRKASGKNIAARHTHISWSLHWSLSGGPMCSCPQNVRTHLLLSLASPGPSRPGLRGVGGRSSTSSMISPTTRKKRSLFSTNCSNCPSLRSINRVRALSRSSAAMISLRITLNPYMCTPRRAAEFCLSSNSLCCRPRAGCPLLSLG